VAHYYYAVASLPYLLFEQEKSVDVNEFLAFCHRQLSQTDYHLLTKASLEDFPEPEKPNPVLTNWQNWEKALRNELVKLRAHELGFEPTDMEEAPDVLEVKDLAREVFSQDSPLQAELMLMRARWDYLERLEINHFFDIEKLIIYYLKLQLLARKEQFKKEYGEEQFEKNYNTIKDRFYNREETETSSIFAEW
jgi:hypothetical protein